MTSKVGFVGVGIMGNGMVRCLLQESRKVVLWNRDSAKAAAVALDFPGQCTVAASAAAVVEACDVTYCMLSTVAASEAVFPEVVAAVTTGKAIVDCATLTPERMDDMAQAVGARGGRFLEAPVSGSKGPAEAGQLIFLCGGDQALYAEVRPDLAVMGKADLFFGPVGKGTQMKLVVNMMMGEMMSTLAEGLHLATAAGLPTDLDAGLLKVLDLGVMANPLFKMKGPKMVNHDHAPNFPLKHAQKDMGFALGLGNQLGVPLPAAATSNATYVAALEKGLGDEDFSAVFEVAN